MPTKFPSSLNYGLYFATDEGLFRPVHVTDLDAVAVTSKNTRPILHIEVEGDVFLGKLENDLRAMSLAELERVIFNDPATIAFWSDGTKTVVKCQGDDKYDARMGILLCTLKKKVFGNETRPFNDFLKDWEI